MAPSSIDCTSSLYCAEDALGVVAWDDENGSFFYEEDQQQYLDDLQAFVHAIGDQAWDEGGLSALAEKETLYVPRADYLERLQNNSVEARARQNAVGWILKAHAHYGFGPVTAVLSVNYLDRFLSSQDRLQQDKPWMSQLAAVTCLSLAAKVEETEVPLLLDLQVEEAKYVFESRTIQRMELLVLGKLDWRVTSVTPLSYIDHAIRGLGIQNNLCWSFVMRCSELLLSTLKDVRFLAFLPSVVAAAIMSHVINEIEPANADRDCENRLLGVMKVNKETMESCIRLIRESIIGIDIYCGGLKRKCSTSIPIPGSPHAVLDASFSCDSENTPGSCDSDTSIFSVSPSALKKRRLDQVCGDLPPPEGLLLDF